MKTDLDDRQKRRLARVIYDSEKMYAVVRFGNLVAVGVQSERGIGWQAFEFQSAPQARACVAEFEELHAEGDDPTASFFEVCMGIAQGLPEVAE